MQNNFVNKFLKNFERLNNEFSEDKIRFECDKELNSNIIAKIVPFYINSDSLQFNVLVEIKYLDGVYRKIGIPYGFVPITYELPVDKQIDIEELFEKLPIEAELLNAGPVGSLFPDPCDSDIHYEFIMMEITPPKFQDEYNKIVYQDEKRLIGSVPFNDVVKMIMEGKVYDLSFRYLMLETYLMFQNISSQQVQQEQQMFVQNVDNENNVKTSIVSDEYIEKNSQKDFAKIFLNK